MKLELKHLAPYLPYGLRYFVDFTDGDTGVYKLEGLTEEEIYLDGYDCAYDSETCKPILRPLSDLIKEIEVNGERFIPTNKIYEIFKLNKFWWGWDVLKNPKEPSLNIELPLEIWNKLYEYHFDIFGLIEKGLAIDINKVNQSN